MQVQCQEVRVFFFFDINKLQNSHLPLRIPWFTNKGSQYRHKLTLLLNGEFLPGSPGVVLSGLPRAPCARVALAVNIEQLLDVHMCIFLGRGQALVTQEFLDDAKVRAPA